MKNALSAGATILLAIWIVAGAAIAITGLHSGGLTGITDVCAAVLVLIALGVLLFHLSAVPRVPMIARIIVGVIAAYAVISLLWALFHGGGLSAALANGALPFFLRGAYIGVEILLPIAALACLLISVAAFVHGNRGAGARNLAAALAIALVVQTGAFSAGQQSLPTIVAFEHPTATANGATVSIASAAGTTADGSGASTASNDGPAGPPTAPCFAPDQGAGKSAANSLGAASSAFGSSSTPTPAPPSAACIGVRNYMTIAQAVLKVLPQRDIDMIPLAQSVPTDAPGIDTFVRDAIGLDIYNGIMRGPLGTWLARSGNPTDKLTLLAALLKMHGMSYTFVRGTLSDAEIAKVIAAATAVPTPAPHATTDPALLVAAGITQAQSDSFTAQGLAKAQKYADDSVPFANGQADALIGQLKSSNVASPGPDPSTTWPQALRTHYWLRLANGMELDPTLADIAPGSHLGTKTTDAPPAANETAQISVRVIETLNRGGSNSDTTVLQATHPSYDFADQSATVALNAPSGMTKKKDIPTVTTVTPVFSMGSQTVTGTPIAVNPSGATLTGVRIEIERDLPGGKPEIFRRTIIGGEPDAASIATHLVRAYHIVVATQPVNQTFASEQFLNTALSMRNYLAWAQDPTSNNRGTVFNPPGPADFPADALNYLERSGALNVAIGIADKVTFAYDRPQIVMVVNGYDRQNATTVETATFDIVDNGMQVIGSDRTAAFRANVARGIADTYIEGEVVPATYSANTPVLLRAANVQNVPMVVLNGVQNRRPSATLPAAVADNLDQTFAHGQVAVAPQQMVGIPVYGQQYGWWAIDANGNTVGRMGSGAGQDLAEDMVVINNLLSAINLSWTLLVCHTGSRAECQSSACALLLGTAIGVFGGAAMGAAGVSAGSAGVAGVGLGGLPGPGWSPGGQICDSAGVGGSPNNDPMGSPYRDVTKS